MLDLDKAIKIATEAHKGQVDKAGADYILHPLRVMEKLETKKEKIVGVLHDVVEDTDVTFEDLENEGFSKEIITALKYLTRRKGEKYFDYIERIKKNSLAKKVKLADLEDNLDISRIKEPTKKDFSLMKRYEKAKKILLK